jgi:hypothetical protein
MFIGTVVLKWVALCMFSIMSLDTCIVCPKEFLTVMRAPLMSLTVR